MRLEAGMRWLALESDAVTDSLTEADARVKIDKIETMFQNFYMWPLITFPDTYRCVFKNDGKAINQSSD